MSDRRNHLLSELSDTTDLEVLFNLEDGQIGYGYVYDKGEDELPVLSNMYQDRFDVPNFLVEEEREVLLQESKMYIGDHNKTLNALNEILGFWSFEEVKDVVVYSFEDFEEAIQYMQTMNLKYIVM